ncbi:MAG: zinc-finger domain-containing protein [Alphaproteobacteria bacterium]
MSDNAIDTPETEQVTTRRIACDGGGAAYGHPRVWLRIGEEGFVECGYCDKKFVLSPDAADH